LDEYDNLSIDEFKKVLRFLQALYKDACNWKTLSGLHGDFGVVLAVECTSYTCITVWRRQVIKLSLLVHIQRWMIGWNEVPWSHKSPLVDQAVVLLIGVCLPFQMQQIFERSSHLQWRLRSRLQ
jgi:hypothetical protein